MDKLDYQIELERTYNKYQLVSYIREQFLECEQFSFIDFLNQHNLDVALCINALAQMVIHKRADVPTLVGALRGYHDSPQHIANVLVELVKHSLIHWDEDRQVFIMALDVSQEVRRMVALYQYPLPMVIVPEKITTNMHTGYLTIKKSVLLKNNHHNLDVCLGHLNKVNSVALRLDEEALHTVASANRHLYKIKNKETVVEFRKRIKALDKYIASIQQVSDIMIEAGNVCYLVHAYDKRGRTYARGYHINYQGADWNKAAIQFADGEIVQ